MYALPRSFAAAVIVLAASGLISACVRPTRAATLALPAAGMSSDQAESEVEAVYRAGIAAFNAHALDTFVEQFADDIAMYTPTGWLHGRAAVRARFDSTFRQFPRVRMQIDTLTVRTVTPTTVTVAFGWRVFPMGEGPAFHGVGSGVYVRRAADRGDSSQHRWVEVLEHETITRVDAELQPPQQSPGRPNGAASPSQS